MKLTVNKSPSESHALTNRIFGNPKDFPEKTKYLLINQKFAFAVKLDKEVPAGTLAFSTPQRQWASLSLNQEIEVTFFDPLSEGSDIYFASLDFELDFYTKGKKVEETYDLAELSDTIHKSFDDLILTKGQSVLFDFHGVNLKATVSSFESVNLEGLGAKAKENEASSYDSSVQRFRGILMRQTNIRFTKAQDSNILLKGVARTSSVISPDFKFEDLGIGGLDQEFKDIFRRAFASRIFPPHIISKLGIRHVKGVLLYGPPGTGKTLMARQIGKMLRSKEPKIVNGPEILNKYVGQSEENIRNLFKDAEDEYKKKGEESDLHIIIFDELDAICKQRGSRNDGTGVGDSVVNQLLSKMDGVEQLNNILVIGMTNRRDMIDDALLRPGRMEVQIEIKLPDLRGRTEILKIHTAKMKKNSILGDDVKVEELAEKTKNFSGAEIEGLVKSATSFALNRHIKGGSFAKVSDDVENIKVNASDFAMALLEVKPAFGANKDEFTNVAANGIIDFGPSVERVISSGELFIKQVQTSKKTKLVSILLHGPVGSGKTSLACELAKRSDFPFIKVISPDDLVGMTELSKCSHIARIFENSYRSPLSVVVVDSIERLLEYVPIGPRFSNAVLQTLLVLFKKTPPSGNRLIIVATTSQRRIIDEMGMQECFSGEMYVPNLRDLEEVENVFKQSNILPEPIFSKCLQTLQSIRLESFSIAIKKLLNIIEISAQDSGNEHDKFIELFKEATAFEQ